MIYNYSKIDALVGVPTSAPTSRLTNVTDYSDEFNLNQVSLFDFSIFLGGEYFHSDPSGQPPLAKCVGLLANNTNRGE